MIVDAAVHPLMPDAEYRRRLPHPWVDAMGLVPGPFGKLYEAAFAEVADLAAAADPDALGEPVFATADVAVAAPPGRGLLPNPQHLAAVTRATNDWVAEHFLTGGWTAAVRVPVTDPVAAVEEIERWAGEPRVVGIVVPLRVHELYGSDRYLPIWEAAAAHRLTVFVLDDLASAAEPVRSPVGQPVSFAENDALRPQLSIVQLAALVMAGTFERVSGLSFVFTDGGADLAAPLLWRVDKDWRSGRVEVPWITELPSAIARRHAAFIVQAQDGRPEGKDLDERLSDVTRRTAALLYGSRTPFWDAVAPGLDTDDAVARIPRLAAVAGVVS
jgi:predicted TIM-barrel fold metal-dependent hydrolase